MLHTMSRDFCSELEIGIFLDAKDRFSVEIFKQYEWIHAAFLNPYSSFVSTYAYLLMSAYLHKHRVWNYSPL